MHFRERLKNFSLAFFSWLAVWPIVLKRWPTKILPSFIVFQAGWNTLEVVWEEKLLLGRPGAAFSRYSLNIAWVFAPPSNRASRIPSVTSSKINFHALPLCYIPLVTIFFFFLPRKRSKITDINISNFPESKFQHFFLFLSCSIVDTMVRWLNILRA